MKYCQIFKNKLDCNNADDVFNCLINNLKETIKTWDYFVNWDKVIKNYRDVEVSLNLLNTLIGKDDIETAARELLKKYPEVIGVISPMDERWTSVYLDYRWFRLAINKTTIKGYF